MRAWILLALALLASACGAVPDEIEAPVQIEAAQVQPATVTARPPALPTAVETQPAATSTATATPISPPADLGEFAGLLNNEADGSAAPLFTARAIGDWTFSLEAQRGSYVLLIPTVAGCGECVFTLRELYQAYPSFQGADMRVVILNLYPQDVPESWENLIEIYPDADFVWCVIEGSDFMIDYGLESLGTTLLIDPQGRIVFRREFPLAASEFQSLFEVVESQVEGA